jgi:NADPH2:quinone reductase
MKVIGTAGTQSGLDLIKKQGANYSFNHRDSNYIEEIKTNFPNGLDLIVEMLANINLNNDLKLLKYKKGKVAVSKQFPTL